MGKHIQHTVESLMARATPIPIAGCWIWEGTTGNSGYGKVSYKGKLWTVTRLIMFLKGIKLSITDKVLHKCDVPLCINPTHLWIGTDAENCADSIAKGRRCLTHVAGGKRKLTLEQVLQIRKQFRQQIAILAEEYGVSEANIEAIFKERIWKQGPVSTKDPVPSIESVSN